MKYGLLTAQMALALTGRDREQVLAQLLELLASRAMEDRWAQIRDERAGRHHHRRDPAKSATGRWMPFARPTPSAQLLAEAAALERFRRESDNLYERVRAQFFLYAIHRFHLPYKTGVPAGKPAPPEALTQTLMQRRFHEAIDMLLRASRPQAPAPPYRAPWPRPIAGSAFRRWRPRFAAACAPCAATNGWPASDIRPIIRCPSGRSCSRAGGLALFPILREATPVRMDLSHSGWSDIFFLGMDFPEGARVLNVSIDLAVRGADRPRPDRPSKPTSA